MARQSSARGGKESSTIAARLLEERRARSMSVRELGRLAGVTASLISQIENGKVNPSVGTLYRMAEALGIRVDEFFAGERTGDAGGRRGEANAAEAAGGAAPPKARGRRRAGAATSADGGTAEQRSGDAAAEADAAKTGAPTGGPGGAAPSRPLSERVVRPGTRNRIALAGGVQWELLTSPDEAAIEDIEVILSTYPPGSESSSEPMRHHGREYGLVLEGELQLEVAGERVTMQRGESITFDSMQPHRLWNTGDVDTVTIWTVHGRRGTDPDA
jgi:transcriptional regulator with XRE-family HTH domain/mannose-6-phosphate isomerase-like protein (cupin superfamily)